VVRGGIDPPSMPQAFIAEDQQARKVSKT